MSLNAILLFVVLLYIYPLKFLFTLMLGGSKGAAVIAPGQAWLLMVIYSTGYATVFGIFALMYRHVDARRDALGLTPTQVFETRAQLGVMLLHVAVALMSVALALIVPARLAGLAGWIYFLIGPSHAVFYTLVARRRRRMLA